ncbi:MAG: hypothetical protein HQM11_11425 [SAR324 cluster bacterium]|nr:hypothetical protein [SAR324 cluster bacterium]
MPSKINVLRHLKTLGFYLPVLLILMACDSRPRSDYNPTYSDQSPLKNTKLIFAVHPLHNPTRLFEQQLCVK